jgi:hypothetical protein
MMKVAFDFDHNKTVELGVCKEVGDDEEHYLVPIKENVKEPLRQMLASTMATFDKMSPNNDFELYQPSEKYADKEKLYLPLDSELNSKWNDLFNSANIQTDHKCLSEPENIVYYYAIFHDKNGTKLIAVRRATQFRGIVKSGNILLQLIDETLGLVEGKSFKLDKDFDYLICDKNIYILRPSAFEFTSDVDASILALASQHARDLGRTMKFLHCDGIAEYVSTHKRAARLVASIRTRKDLARTSLAKLKKGCKDNKIALCRNDGKICPEAGNEMAFLQMLDRRRFSIALTEDGPEFYEATGRRNVS